jgi:hypothetical protein
LCTELCGGDCPFDWECQLLTNSANDVVELCVPPQQILCRPCRADIDCGGTENLCLEQNDGEFCATLCEAGEDCPEGYACDPVTTAAGEETRQCVPLLGVCGDCVDLDDDGYGVGPGCDGLDCDELNPQAYSGATELCDSVDNDCDEAVDEDFDLSSDARNCGVCGNTCTAVGAETACVESACEITVCPPGRYDLNGEFEDGCEYLCIPNPHSPTADLCNTIDDD